MIHYKFENRSHDVFYKNDDAIQDKLLSTALNELSTVSAF
jgi:hypothetical protein